MQMLSYQNSKLSAQLEVQRQEIADLEAKVTSLQSKQIDYEQTLSCVDRLWTQLNEDVAYLVSRLNGYSEDSNRAASASGEDHLQSNGTSSPQQLAGIEDPFLLRLVCANGTAASAVAEKSRELKEDATEVEAALLQRSQATKAVLARLLDLQTQQQQRHAELAGQLGREAGPAAEEEVRAAHACMAGLWDMRMPLTSYLLPHVCMCAFSPPGAMCTDCLIPLGMPGCC